MQREEPPALPREEVVAKWRRRQAEDRDPKTVKRRLQRMFAETYQAAAVFTGLAVWWVLWTRIHMSQWVTVPAAIGVGVLLWRSRSKRVIYASSVAVFLFTIVCTVGVISTSPETVSSMVIDKMTQEGGGYYTSTGQYVPEITVYKVKVACQDSKTGHLVASLSKSSWDALRDGEQVELTYHAERILSVWPIGLAVDSINSQQVIFGGSSGFHGGGWDIFGSALSLVFGMVPLSILIYQEYIKGSL